MTARSESTTRSVETEVAVVQVEPAERQRPDR
jgi:hypothetical protein